MYIRTQRALAVGVSEEQLEPVNTNCIGFKAPNTEHYDDDWEDDKVKNRIGFK